MAAERALQAAGVAGRIVPLPVTISADCGLAWACDRADAGALVRACERLGLAVSAVWDLTGDAPAPAAQDTKEEEEDDPFAGLFTQGGK